MQRTLVLKTTAGADAPERCSQAFTVAATAVASGVPVSLWLTGEASWFAVPGGAEKFELAGSAPLADLLAAVLAGVHRGCDSGRVGSTRVALAHRRSVVVRRSGRG